MTDEVVNDNSFLAGFDSVAGTKTPLADVATPPATPASASEPLPSEPPEPATPSSSVEEPPLDPDKVDEALKTPDPIPGLTAEQLKSLLAKTAEVDSLRSQYDKVAGHVGNLLQEVKALKTPKAEEVLPVDLAKYREEYPDIHAGTRAQIDEQLARYVELEKVLVQEINERQDLAAELQMERLARVHPDWEATVTSNDYALWLATQPAEVQKVAKETASAVELGKVLTLFKDGGKKQVQQDRNTKRLEGALTPTGAAPIRPAEQSEHDAFKAGWAAVRH